MDTIIVHCYHGTFTFDAYSGMVISCKLNPEFGPMPAKVDITALKLSSLETESAPKTANGLLYSYNFIDMANWDVVGDYYSAENKTQTLRSP